MGTTHVATVIPQKKQRRAVDGCPTLTVASNASVMDKNMDKISVPPLLDFPPYLQETRNR